MIYMDSMAFGMGNCCFQITLGFCNLNISKLAYDLLVPICPIILALTASTPIFKGKLAGHDTRFDVLSQSVDDRTANERDVTSDEYIEKPRYSNVLSYLSENVYVQDHHNDYKKFKIDEEELDNLVKNGIPKRLATHFCNLMVRDPLVIFDEKIDIEESDDYSHFESFQSTNWNTLRLKPPRIEDRDNCFKIEFRVSELNLSPYENAAIGSFVVLFARMIYKYDFNTIIPISKVDENYKKAVLNDAVIKEKFWFRTNGLSVNESKYTETNKTLYNGEEKDLEELLKKVQDKSYDEQVHELSVDDILCGSEKYDFPGLLWMMEDFVSKYIDTEEEKSYYRKHLEFIKLRGKGKLCTDAKYIRNFVLNHNEYKQDSIVSELISYDLVNHLLDIQSSNLKPRELFN